MATHDLLMASLVFLGVVNSILILKIVLVMRKMEKLYDFYIRSKNDPELDEIYRGIPPTNGQCPKIEDLEKMG